MVLTQAAQQTVHGNDACDVQINIQPTAKVMIYSIDGNVNDMSCPRTSTGDDGEVGLALTAKADGEGGIWGAEILAEEDVFEDDTESRKV